MKKVIVALALIGTALTSTAGQKYSPGKYGVDPAHSKVGFEVAHLVISTVEGRFKGMEGSIELDKNFSRSKVNASVQIDTIDTGVEKRDGHLKSPDFFDAAKYPKMTFSSKKVTGTPNDFTLIGDLTIKGKTSPVKLKGSLKGVIKNDGYGNEKVAFVASGKISRKEFGITWNQAVELGPVVGDEVTIQLNIQAALPQQK